MPMTGLVGPDVRIMERSVVVLSALVVGVSRDIRTSVVVGIVIVSVLTLMWAR